MTEPCIAEAIWTRVRGKWPTPPRSAQDRHALDQFLRAELSKIGDPGLRAHAGEILRAERNAFLYRINPPDVWNYLASLDRRLTNLEAELHRQAKASGPREISSIQPRPSAPTTPPPPKPKR